MSDVKPVPAEVWPVAYYLAEEMQARGWTCVDVASRMPGDYAINIGIINFTLAVQDENFLLGEGTSQALGQAFGVDPEFFGNLHDAWLRHPEARQPFECPEELFDGLAFPPSESDNRTKVAG